MSDTNFAPVFERWDRLPPGEERGRGLSRRYSNGSDASDISHDTQKRDLQKILWNADR